MILRKENSAYAEKSKTIYRKIEGNFSSETDIKQFFQFSKK